MGQRYNAVQALLDLQGRDFLYAMQEILEAIGPKDRQAIRELLEA